MEPMRAGFAVERITPPEGTRMMGAARRDREGGCTGVHDDLYIRALWLAHGGQEALIASFDLCFLGRRDADRLKAAIARTLVMVPRQMMLAATHTHAGPAVGTWACGSDVPPDELYLGRLETAAVQAAARAKNRAQAVTLWAGVGRTTLPMSRRRLRDDGTAAFAPSPKGTVCGALPVVALKNADGQVVTLLHSVSCHPSTIAGREISADFPGVAAAALDERFGRQASLFLQGAGGDAKVRMSAAGDRWKSNDWTVIDEAGRTLADEVLAVVEGGLSPVEPALKSAMVEAPLRLGAPPSREELRAAAALVPSGPDDWQGYCKPPWAAGLLARLDRGEALAREAPILVQGVQLGEGLRLIALEGEPVAELGLHVMRAFGQGVTIPVGYANGQGLYLPVGHMLAEGGYEVESFWEYGWPAPAAEGAEEMFNRALPGLRAQGIA